ncbi:hypothetical protein [Pontibacter indicus]|uniref:DUF4400 domain-containing protein n=1 Tax=Pontibacter indicus TaxID=1317125 RepID=A0A1R3XQ23_9BACT|nr:hypothetical protein [Pontibacter indicus]SIT94040.1 hypothetical protein SAMN05444128_3407 [Pontibacter indicus]
MDLFNSIFHYFTDRTRKLPAKIILVLLLGAIVLLADNLLSFSYYYNNARKIEQAKALSEILQDTSLTKHEKAELFTLRRNIIKHATWKDYTWAFFSNIHFSNSKKQILDETSPNASIATRSYFWHFISSSWLIVFAIIAVPFAAYFDKTVSLGLGLTILIVFEPTLLGLAWLLAKTFSYIPIILGNSSYNYLLNALLCGILFIVPAQVWIYYERKKKIRELLKTLN